MEDLDGYDIEDCPGELHELATPGAFDEIGLSSTKKIHCQVTSPYIRAEFEDSSINFI